MEAINIAIGSEFVRKNGTVVRITDERLFRGMRELELTPIIGKGRISWKCDQAILREMKPNTVSTSDKPS